MKVLSLAMKQSSGSWARRKVYLYGYFFEEHTGLGLPVDMAYQSALNAMANYNASSRNLALGHYVT